MCSIIMKVAWLRSALIDSRGIYLHSQGWIKSQREKGRGWRLFSFSALFLYMSACFACAYILCLHGFV